MLFAMKISVANFCCPAAKNRSVLNTLPDFKKAMEEANLKIDPGGNLPCVTKFSHAFCDVIF